MSVLSKISVRRIKIVHIILTGFLISSLIFGFFDNILAVKAAIINDVLELKNKGLAFLEEVVNHFKAKVQMGQSFVGSAGGTNSSTKRRPSPVKSH